MATAAILGAAASLQSSADETEAADLATLWQGLVTIATETSRGDPRLIQALFTAQSRYSAGQDIVSQLLARCRIPDDRASANEEQLILVLRLIQGYTLMLPTIYQPRLARREAIQSLLGLLGNSASSNNDSLTTLLALDVLLAALVDHPPGVRMFEQLSGLELVVRLLRNKEAGKHTRMKALEFLHFYLLPESSTDLTPRSPSKLRRVSPSASLVSSRSRQRTASGGSTASSVSCSSLFASISEEGTSSPQRSESRVPWSPQTPRRARAPDSPSRSPALRSPVKVLEIPPTPEQDDANILVVPQTSSPAGSVMRTPERKDDNENVSPFARPLRASLAMTPPRRSRPLSESSPAHQSPNKRLSASVSPTKSSRSSPTKHRPAIRPDGTRDVEAKKALLGRYLGNVDGLVEKLKLMNLTPHTATAAQ